MDMELEMRDISRKWVAIIGVGYNPDTAAGDYSPALTKDQQREYAFDMRKLRRMERVCGMCVYEAGLNAMADAGLIPCEF
jgi:hypothetical protein